MSVRTTWSSPSLIRPIAIPATGRVILTPAAWRASVDAQTEPIDEEPFDSSVSETSRIVYGNSDSSGIIGSSARWARFP